MKTKIVRKEEEQKFPALFIAPKDNTIILVNHQNDDNFEGVVLSTESDENFIGEFSRDWDVSSFQPFYGSITLES